MTAPLIRLAHIDYRAGGKIILQNAGIQVSRGEIVTLIGPNGAGKTTLVAIALKLLRATRGTVEHRSALRTGYVPQKISIDAALPLSVRRFLQLERAHPRAELANALAQAGAPHATLIDAPMQSLSGGEMRRVLLARALLRKPELLILDEPGAGMDVTGQAELYALIQNLREQRHCGVLLVSHDLHMVMAATDRVFCLNRHMCCSGRPESVRRHPQFLALFGCEAASGLAPYQHRHDHAHDLHGDIAPGENAAHAHSETLRAGEKVLHAAGEISHAGDNPAHTVSKTLHACKKTSRAGGDAVRVVNKNARAKCKTLHAAGETLRMRKTISHTVSKTLHACKKTSRAGGDAVRVVNKNARAKCKTLHAAGKTLRMRKTISHTVSKTLHACETTAPPLPPATRKNSDG